MTEFTFVLNLDTASPDTYQTWCTVRIRNGVLERKSNEGGNGQSWELFGYGNPSEYKLFTTNANETQAARIVAHVVRTVGLRCNVKGYGAAWRNATVVESIVNPKTKRKLTAAPSIRDGSPPRDKNVKARRWTGPLDAMIRKRDAKNAPRQKRFTIDPATLRVS